MNLEFSKLSMKEMVRVHLIQRICLKMMPTDGKLSSRKYYSRWEPFERYGKQKIVAAFQADLDYDA